MNQPLVERVARLLADMGPLNTKQISAHLGETVGDISSATRKASTMGRYGLSVLSYEQVNQRGHPPKVLAVDTSVLIRYLEMRGPFTWKAKVPRRKLRQPPAVKKPKPEAPPERTFSHGPHRTVWQPTSPYFKGAINGNETAAPSAPTV